jgi:hypothetical protein
MLKKGIDMKTQLLLLVSSLSFLIQTGFAAEPNKPDLVGVSSDHIFVPSGFDDNDNAQIVISGNLPNSCYRVANPLVKVSHRQRKVYIKPQAYVYPSSWCLQVLVPYIQTLNLGVLNASAYEVIEVGPKDQQNSRGKMSIKRSMSSNADDFLYASVKSATTAKEAGKNILRINGNLSSNCMHLKEVKVIHKTEDVIEVLPITEVQDSRGCDQKVYPFETQVELPQVSSHSVLIHIRTLNGQSVNLVEDLD